MKNSAVKTKVEIENGIYNAMWSAYRLEILNPDNSMLLTVETYMGVKGLNIPKVVKIIDGKVEFVN